MYKANPKVNEELKQRLPSPVKRHCSETTPQPGLVVQGLSPDTSQSPLETGALEKKFKGLNTLRPGEGTVLVHPPPMPPPPPAPARSMEKGLLSPQTDTAEKELDSQELDTSASNRPHNNNPEPTTIRNTDEDHGNSKVCRDGSRQVPFLDKERNIAFLLKELDSLRDLNKKLQDKLALKEKELETIRLDSQLQEEKLEAHACEKAAALVEEIYKAQRERDQAVMARLRLANEERDEALLRAKKLQEAALELENINPEESDTELEELLNRVSSADSALSIERNGIAIMECIQRARERRAKITCEEMKAVKVERDNALTKCKRLEQELFYHRELGQTSSSCHTATSSNQEGVHMVQIELEAVRRERDVAIELCHKLEEELQALRKDQSVQQSQTDEEAPSTTVQSQSLRSRVQQLNSELQTTQTQLRLSRESEREATEKVHKLERLVEVLRKKVGTGSLRTVI